MSFNSYELAMEDGRLITKKCSIGCLTTKEQMMMFAIEERIAEIIIREQRDKLGINKIGNALRSDSQLKKLFSKHGQQDFVIRKMTENKRAFTRVFLHDLTEDTEIRNIFFVLEPSFGREAMIVDGSFITVEGIQQELDNLSKLFEPKFDLSKVLIAEMTGFKDYYIEVVSDSMLSKRYAKLIMK